VFRSLTTRGRCFVAAGVVAGACGAALGQPDLLRVGALLLIVPLLSALGARRARSHLTCTRRTEPSRLQAGGLATLTLRVSSTTRLRTGLLLAEDTLPRGLSAGSSEPPAGPGRGAAPRFVLDGLRRGRTLRYQVRASARGKYTVGPLRVRAADSFGLVAITQPAGPVATLTVTPRIVPLPPPPLGGTWPGDGDRGSISGGGTDDVSPRPYQVGDGLSRVHWRSTARYGELMVRHEERHWRLAAALFLDTRRAAFGSGALFEFAVTVAASAGTALARREADARLVIDTGEIPRQATFGDTLLDALAVIRPSRSSGLGPGIEALRMHGGQLIAILGALTEQQARQVAAARRPTAPTTPALALLVGEPVGPAARILTAAGWRVAAATDDDSLVAAWRELCGGSHATVDG
jgi:uncharacterized protein (DUF58 family)